MNNNYIPLLPNNHIKFIKKEEKKENKYTNNELKIFELYKNIRNNKFKSWLNSPLKNKEVSSTGKYKGTYIYDNDSIVTKQQFVNKFLHDIVVLLDKNFYTIDNNKQFRDEIASFIYKQSK